MDDANLSKLSVSQPGLKPEFNKDILNYIITVPFSVETLKITATTSDKSASFSIKSNSGYGEEVKLLEGDNKIQIEVTSEDGTAKKYSITCNRLSASNASLKKLTFINNIDLQPKFDSDHLIYKSFVHFNQMSLEFEFTTYDPSCEVQVILNNTKQTSSSTGKFKLDLNYSRSQILINVKSSNKTKEQIYSITVIKPTFPRLCIFQDQQSNKYEDLISLGLLYCPISYQKLMLNYSEPILEIFKRISNFENFSFINMTSQDEATINIDLENQMSCSKVKIPYLNGGYSKQVDLKDVFSLIDEIINEDQMKSLEEEVKNSKFTEIKEIPDTVENYQVKPWEKQLQIIYDETDPKILLENSRESFQKYLSEIDSTSALKKNLKSNKEDSAIYHLNKSIYEASTAIKFNTKDYNLHFWLAMLLEEKNFFENIYGPEEQEEKSIDSLVLQNRLAEESSKEDEINAICKLRNFNSNCSNAEKLKALDMEYQHLKETNQFIKAEQIQALYQYKAKKVINESKKDNINKENNNYIYQANMKYSDGLQIILQTKQENFNAYFTMGRSLFSIGNYKQALVYFKRCLIWSNQELQTLSRFYFAYSLSKQVDLIDDNNIKLILYFMCSGLQLFLKNLTKKSQIADLHAENYFSIFNLEFLEAFLIVGKLKKIYSNFECIQPEHSFRYCAWLSCLGILELNKKSPIDKETFMNSKLIKDLINLLVESHYNLAKLNNLKKSQILKQSMNLIDLIRALDNKESEHVLKIQEEISQDLVYLNPNEYYFLYLLGSSKLDLYDLLFDNKLESDEAYLNNLLNESLNSLIVCNEIIEKSVPLNSKANSLISEQKWWQKRLDTEKIKLEASKKEVKSEPINRPPSKTKDTKPVPVKSPAKPIPINNKKPIPVPSKNTKTTQPQHNHSKKPIDTQQQVQSVPVTVPPPEPIITPNNQEEESKEKIQINIDKKVLLIHCYLYTARAHSRLKQFDLAKSFYLKVIESEPKKQDAYIELANMLKKNNDILGAVDVYSKYPLDENKINLSNESSFDDALICGELVSLLISIQNYDDTRLVKYLILWARIFGISVIEKYIGILDKANKTKVCKEVYAGVHKKSIDDPDLNQFFKLKGWI
ncbi:unnamed protein product [Brachionus calyciflorus]|uniref:Cadherin-like beta-sandwich-like domain-containing protein n=1 Tax=Brachionus calyciflorus TaxID=104777 RepID=A0A813MZ48_9BILA|nr:unnamed protein product [Brachionus calyciflorus]